MEKKSISHQTLCTENESINDYQNIQNNLRTDLTVNLIPEKNYIYIGTKFNNKKDGLGLELFSNTNAKFFGRFINDKRVSIGRFIINNENDSYYYFGYVKGIQERMEQVSKEIIKIIRNIGVVLKMAKKMVQGIIIGVIIRIILENGSMIIQMDMVFIIFKMDLFIKANGNIIKWMVQENSLFLK